jgi:hypothetical protein
VACYYLHRHALLLLQVCHSSLQRSTGLLGWAHRMSGTQTLLDGLQYINCCSQQLGEFDLQYKYSCLLLLLDSCRAQLDAPHRKLLLVLQAMFTKAVLCSLSVC